ncbi:MAG: hypothetical protein E2O84_04995 [Bacteroidetes bacterium]|nr:MAG: hypothetical protein E2O84_04995 [Bacteroidota bacterium]
MFRSGASGYFGYKEINHLLITLLTDIMSMVHRGAFCASVLLLFLSAGGLRPATAQENIMFSGEVFADYLYQFSTLSGQGDGNNRFTYRRARLTADADLSEQFSARFRIEANDLIGTANGLPTPYVKDLFLKWKDAFGEGHTVLMGLQPPPSWQPAEKFWGYRSVSKTLNDRVGVLSSRDMGVLVRGPLAADGKVRYGIMIGNANGVRAENDKYKRVYGQLEFYPSESFAASLGSHYQLTDGGYEWNFNGFAGFRTRKFRIGVEGFYHPVKIKGISDTQDWLGLSGFVVVDVFKNNSVLARVAFVERPDEAILKNTLFFVAGFAIKPHHNVQFIPNIVFIELEGEENPSVTGRMTLWIKF